MTSPCSRREMQLVEAARQLAGSQVVVIGSGAAFAVAPLALRTSAPGASFVIDSGVVGARFQTAIRSVVDPAMPGALRLGSMTNVFLELLQAGRVDTSLLSAAQIDATGNLNSTYIGSMDAPTKRLPGAGGATAMAAFCRRLVVVVRHERRRFVDRVDYITTAGPRTDSPTRLQETIVVTDLAVLRSSADQPALQLAALMPGVCLEEVQDHTGFALQIPTPIPRVLPPEPDVLRILRQDIDPTKLYL